jgi:thiamine biosynthesis lipoprotein
MPASHFASVTIIAPDSGFADALSTALFTMNYESGMELIKKIDDVEVLWIAHDGTQYYSAGLEALIKK